MKRPHSAERTLRWLRWSPYRMGLLFALIVFLITFSAASFFAKSTQDQNKADYQARLDQQASSLASFTRSSVDGVNRLLLSSSAVFAVKPDVTNDEWQRIYQMSQDDEAFSEVVGIGFASVIAPESREDFQQAQRDNGRENFTVNSPSPQDRLSVITYLAPNSPENDRAIGYDMYSESARRTAQQQARDTAETVMTAPVNLVQDGGSADKKGILAYYPVYSTPDIPTTVEARRANLRGFVYAIVRPADMLSKYLSDHRDEYENIAVTVRDETDSANPSLLYQNGTATSSTGIATSQINVDNRTWGVAVNGGASYTSLASPIVLFVLGGIVSLLLSILTYWIFIGRIKRLANVYEGEVKRTKEELLALASHQLRTPASGVKQYLGLLNSGMLGELSSEQKSVAQKAYDANERQLEIINEMLYVSKADAGQLVIEPKTFNLTALTQTVIDGFAEQASQKDIRIAFRTKRDYQVTADDRYVTMAVENLISNAIKYSYPSSTVRVGIASRGKMVSLYVKDRGVGIAKHNIEMVFGKFNRVDNPLSHSEGGSGLGLFLARQLARAHGGDVTVESALEKGSTFSMTLPKKLTVNQTIVHLNRITKIEDE